MPSYETPEPIAVTIEIGVGDVRISAGDRTETVVEVRPTDPKRHGDVIAAEQATVELIAGRLLVRTPKNWRQYTFWGGRESVDVLIELPTGSRLQGDAEMGSLHCAGRLGECRFRTGMGDLHVEETGPVQLRTGSGDIVVDRSHGTAELSTASGSVWIGAINGAGTVKNSNGDTWIGAVNGDLRVSAANGKISVEQANGPVSAKTANGDVLLGEVARGAVSAQTAYGAVEVGVREGVAAWLDVSTSFGMVHNELDIAGPPDEDSETVDVRAHSAFGNITIRRSLVASVEDDRP